MLGWGIVPVVKEDLERESIKSLIQRFEHGMAGLAVQSIDEDLLARAS